MNLRHAAALTGSLIACALLLCGSLHAADVALWHELDIVPMPKEISLTGRDLPLEGAVIVLGAEPSRQDEIGAKWLSDECVALGGAAIPAVTAADNAPLRIIVGTRESNPLIAAAAEAGAIDVGPGNPGERGYVIVTRQADGATEILLGGADEIGALYACVTLAGLMQHGADGVTLREATVRDWPDFVHMTFGAGYTGDMGGADLGLLWDELRWSQEPDADLRRRFLAAMLEHYERLLRWKIGTLWINVYDTVTPATRAVIKEAIQLGRERGIGALYYSMQPFAGRVADYPDFAGPKLPPGRYPEWIRCWSLDDMRREAAERFAKMCGDIGYTDIGFHDSDTGGFLNPAQWEERCEVCRERWGDDYAAATANKFQIYYDALKEHAPDARMHIVIYPYGLSVYTQEGAERYVTGEFGPGPGVADSARQLREKYTRFWQRVDEMLPDDINVCIREEHPENVAAFRDIIGDRGIFIFFKLLADPWTAFFSESPRWSGTFYRNSRDFLFPPTLETYVPIQALAVREYAWNSDAPGAEPYYRLPVEEQWRHCEPQGPVYEVVLPHVVRAFFGHAHAEEIAGALSKNVNQYEIFENKLYGGNPQFLKSAERWRWQAEESAEGAELLDRVWERRTGPEDRLGMTPYAFRRYLYLREIFHTCRYMAAARAGEETARELARAGDLEGAQAALAAARQAAEDGRRDAEQLLTDRPDEPLYVRQDQLDRGRRMVFRLFTPDAGIDWDAPLQRITQTEQELPALVAAGEVDPNILKRLESNRIVHMGTARESIAVDGQLDEADWMRVYPSESFFVYREGQRIADVPTQTRLLCDDEHVYVAASCWLPAGGEPFGREREHDDAVLEDDAVEIFLAPPGMNGGYVHLAVNAFGSARDQLCAAAKDDTGVTKFNRDPEWNAEGLQVAASRQEGRWDVEIALPLSALGETAAGGGWAANFAREYRSAAGTQELSSILPTTAEDFHHRAFFRQVNLTAADFSAPDPEIELAVTGLEAKTETLDDRIATVCHFGAAVHASRALHGATLTAEAYGPDGRLHQRRVVAQQPRILYDWEPTDEFRIEFTEVVPAGGVRLLLETNEATVERWVRLGGWQGGNEAGSLFSPDGVAGAALAGDCVLPSKLLREGQAEPLELVPSRTGTLEMWLRPNWTGGQALLSDRFDLQHIERALLHFGPLRADNPYLANHSSLLIEHVSPDWLRFVVAASNYAGWSTMANLREAPLNAGQWHHLAAVWDGDADRPDWMRIYLDGKRVNGEIAISKEERFGDDPSLRVAVDKPYTIQVGCLTSGRQPGDALIDELRISRTARYSADFSPTQGPLPLDADSSFVLHFDGNLIGEGRDADGQTFRVEAVAGVPEHH
jgi:hypothetical protein